MGVHLKGEIIIEKEGVSYAVENHSTQ
jgi:hypothetical protein